MSLDEILLVIDVYKEKNEHKIKQQASDMYTLSVLIASFVNKSLVGKDIPKKSECFPNIIEFKQEEQRQQVQMYKEAFKKRAESSWNKKKEI